MGYLALFIADMEFPPNKKAQFVNVCNELGKKPKTDSKEDFITWMRQYVATHDNGTSEVKPEIGIKPAAPIR